MSIETARDRLKSRPRLRGHVKEPWLVCQCGRPAQHRHPLYGLLEWGSAEPGIEAYLGGLERALAAPIGGAVVHRAKRLTQGVEPRWSDYWSAIDELSFGSRLVDCGMTVRFGDPDQGEPDVIAEGGGDTVRLEMTSREVSAELFALQAEITGGWTAPLVSTLTIGRGDYRPNAEQRSAIAGAVRALADRDPPVETEVDLSGLVEPRMLRVTVGPAAGWGYVNSHASVSFCQDDLVPAIEEAVARKRAQTRHMPALVIGVALNSLTFDPYTWALRHLLTASHGGALPTIQVATNVLGVVAFLRGIPGEQPVMALWLGNRQSSAPYPSSLATVLDCLGAAR